MPKADETMYVYSYVHIHTRTPQDEYEWTVVMQLLTCSFAPSHTSIISRSYLSHQMFAKYAHGVPAAIAPCKMVTAPQDAQRYHLGASPAVCDSHL